SDKVILPDMRQSILVSDFFFSSRRRHTRSKRDWSSDVCSSDLAGTVSAALCCAPDSTAAAQHRAADTVPAPFLCRRKGTDRGLQIGRASCREREWQLRVWGGDQAVRERKRGERRGDSDSKRVTI